MPTLLLDVKVTKIPMMQAVKTQSPVLSLKSGREIDLDVFEVAHFIIMTLIICSQLKLLQLSFNMALQVTEGPNYSLSVLVEGESWLWLLMVELLPVSLGCGRRIFAARQSSSSWTAAPVSFCQVPSAPRPFRIEDFIQICFDCVLEALPPR